MNSATMQTIGFNGFAFAGFIKIVIPSTISCENRTLIYIFRDMYSDVLVAN